MRHCHAAHLLCCTLLSLMSRLPAANQQGRGTTQAALRRHLRAAQAAPRARFSSKFRPVHTPVLAHSLGWRPGTNCWAGLLRPNWSSVGQAVTIHRTEMSQTRAWPCCQASPSLGHITTRPTAMTPSIAWSSPCAGLTCCTCASSTPAPPHISGLSPALLPASLIPPALVCLASVFCISASYQCSGAWAVSSHMPHLVSLAMAMAHSPWLIQQEGLLFNKISYFPLSLGAGDLGDLFQPS